MPVMIKDLPRPLQRVVLERAPWASLETPLQAAFVFYKQPEGADYWWRLARPPQRDWAPWIAVGLGLITFALVAGLTGVIRHG